jgi:hypothetical protein
MSQEFPQKTKNQRARRLCELTTGSAMLVSEQLHRSEQLHTREGVAGQALENRPRFKVRLSPNNCLSLVDSKAHEGKDCLFCIFRIGQSLAYRRCPIYSG